MLFERQVFMYLHQQNPIFSPSVDLGWTAIVATLNITVQLVVSQMIQVESGHYLVRPLIDGRDIG
jgi:hypothetical protein